MNTQIIKHVTIKGCQVPVYAPVKEQQISIDVTRDIQEAGVAYIEHIIRDIQGELQAHVGMHADFDRVLLFGGGAAFLKNGLPARNIEVIVLPEPEYANARGFQTLAFAKGV